MDQAALIALILVLFPITFLAMWSGVVVLLSHLSGWRRLASVYGVAEGHHGAQGGTEHRWQTGTVGLVGYRNCLHIRVSSSGIALSVAWPFRVGHQSLYLPWSALHGRKDLKIFWYQVSRFQVGTPPIGRVQIPTKVLEYPGPR